MIDDMNDEMKEQFEEMKKMTRLELIEKQLQIINEIITGVDIVEQGTVSNRELTYLAAGLQNYFIIMPREISETVEVSVYMKSIVTAAFILGRKTERLENSLGDMDL